MFLKGLLLGTLVDNVVKGLWNAAKGVLGPFLGQAWGTTASKVGEKMMEKAMTLLDKESVDEQQLNDALPFLSANERSEFFLRLGLILTNLAKGDIDLALEYTEWYRRLLIQKTPQQTAEMIKEHIVMPPDMWEEYLMNGLSIRTKSSRYKYRHFWKVKAALLGSTPSGTDLARALRSISKKSKVVYKSYSKKIDDWFKIKILYLSLVFAGLATIIVAAYTFKSMAIFIIFTLLLVFAISFVDAIWVWVVTYGVHVLDWLGIIDSDRIDYAIEMGTDQSFLRYLRATQLALLHLATIAAIDPSLLFSKAIWAYIFIVIISGLVYLIAFGSKRSYLVPALGVHYFVILVLLFYPQPVVSAQTELQNLQAKLSLLTMQRKLSARTLFTVQEKTLGWSVVSRDEFGKPIKDGDKYKLAPCYVTGRDGNSVQMEFLPGQIYQVSEDAETIDAGEPLIKVRQKNSDGSWLITDQTVECFIPYSKTELAEVKPTATPVVVTSSTPAVVTSSTPAVIAQQLQAEVAKKTKPETSSKPESVKTTTSYEGSVYVSANAAYCTRIFVRNGQQIQITATGQVNSMPDSRRTDRAFRWVGPDGWKDATPGFIIKAPGSYLGPLPGDRDYMALVARVSKTNPFYSDGGWTLVGSNKTFTADQDGYIYLMVNEKITDQYGVQHLDWLSNNQGGFNVVVRLL